MTFIWLDIVALVAVFYGCYCLKYSLLEQFGAKTGGVIIGKDTEQHHYQSRSVLLPLIKALIGRHKLSYRFDDHTGRRHFATARVDDDLHFYTKMEEEIEVMYLPFYPRLNTLSALLSVRFRELVVVGGLFLALAMLGFAWRFVLQVPAQPIGM